MTVKILWCWSSVLIWKQAQRPAVFVYIIFYNLTRPIIAQMGIDPDSTLHPQSKWRDSGVRLNLPFQMLCLRSFMYHFWGGPTYSSKVAPISKIDELLILYLIHPTSIHPCTLLLLWGTLKVKEAISFCLFHSCPEFNRYISLFQPLPHGSIDLP